MSLLEEYNSMTRTEYLFGVDPSYFKGQEEFAKNRLATAKKLKKKMAALDMRDYTLEEVDAIHFRYREIEEAEGWARKLLDEALGAINNKDK